ncbi:MAG: hypothetical protein V9G19_20320 [Tetrasphaera sp.]
MAYDEDLANRIRTAVDDEPGITEKRMFGGARDYGERQYGGRGS